MDCVSGGRESGRLPRLAGCPRAEGRASGDGAPEPPASPRQTRPKPSRNGAQTVARAPTSNGASAPASAPVRPAGAGELARSRLPPGRACRLAPLSGRFGRGLEGLWPRLRPSFQGPEAEGKKPGRRSRLASMPLRHGEKPRPGLRWPTWDYMPPQFLIHTPAPFEVGLHKVAPLCRAGVPVTRRVGAPGPAGTPGEADVFRRSHHTR